MGAAGMWIGLISGLSFASAFLIQRFLRKTRLRLQMSESKGLEAKMALEEDPAGQ
jgi:Na+-driven multidrug efflux pump